MSQPFLGQITVYPYSFPPMGWMDCAGQILPISQYTALFSLLGTQFGGNGTSNFALPNLQGTVPVGQGQLTGGSNYTMGETGGVEAVTVTSSTMPSHTHTLAATTAKGSINAPAGDLFGQALEGNPASGHKGDIYNTASPDTPLTPNSITLAGNNQPHNNIQPFLALRYCIAISGIFPTRN
jgi:microcystin-dependent protein